MIEQLKNRVNAMCMPANDLLSNWAYPGHLAKPKLPNTPGSLCQREANYAPTATIGFLGPIRRAKVPFEPSFATLALRLYAIRSQNSAAKISKCDSSDADALRVGLFAYFGARFACAAKALHTA